MSHSPQVLSSMWAILYMFGNQKFVPDSAKSGWINNSMGLKINWIGCAPRSALVMMVGIFSQQRRFYPSTAGMVLPHIRVLICPQEYE